MQALHPCIVCLISYCLSTYAMLTPMQCVQEEMKEKHQKELLSLEVTTNNSFDCVLLFSCTLRVRHITLNWLTGKELMLIAPICELFEVLFYVTLLMMQCCVQDERNKQHEKKLQALEVSNLSIGVQMYRRQY